MSDDNLSDDERRLIEQDFRIKTLVLQEAARREELVYSPNTDDVRISALQAKYRKEVIKRYKRRYGMEPDISLLDADHPVDLIVGGDADQRLKLLHQSVNRSIGSQLKRQAKKQKLKRGDKINKIIVNGT